MPETKTVRLVIEVQVPGDTAEHDVQNTLNRALDQADELGAYPAPWVVGGLLHDSSTEVVDLLDEYGRGKFGDEWWPGEPYGHIPDDKAARLVELLGS